MNILYEDNHLIAVIKPPGVLSQADGGDMVDMVNLLKEDIKERYQKPGNVFVGLVHRLDRNVGGTMVFAKTSKGASRLSASLRDKQFYKAYFALADGIMEASQLTLTNYLLKDEKQNKVMETRNTAEGKLSVLKVIRLAVNHRTHQTLVLALPITGRSHQIRVQMALASLPLAGDAKYGFGMASSGRREDLGLWSCHVAVKHPVREEIMHFTSAPEREGVWNAFCKEDYEKGMNVPAERIVEWFTI